MYSLNLHWKKEENVVRRVRPVLAVLAQPLVREWNPGLMVPQRSKLAEILAVLARTLSAASAHWAF